VTVDLLVPMKFPCPIIVAMDTKIGLFSQKKISHNSAYTNATAAEYDVFGHSQFNAVYKR